MTALSPDSLKKLGLSTRVLALQFVPFVASSKIPYSRPQLTNTSKSIKERYYIAISDDSRRRAAQYLRTTPHMLENIETKEDLARLIETTLAPAWEKQIESTLALYGLSPYAQKIHKDLSSMHIVYTDEQKRLYEQPLSDLPDSGTLIDPDTGDDMPIVGYTLV